MNTPREVRVALPGAAGNPPPGGPHWSDIGHWMRPGTLQLQAGKPCPDDKDRGCAGAGGYGGQGGDTGQEIAAGHGHVAPGLETGKGNNF